MDLSEDNVLEALRLFEPSPWAVADVDKLDVTKRHSLVQRTAALMNTSSDPIKVSKPGLSLRLERKGVLQ